MTSPGTRCSEVTEETPDLTSAAGALPPHCSGASQHRESPAQGLSESQ